jgi:hypothetical protein
MSSTLHADWHPQHGLTYDFTTLANGAVTFNFDLSYTVDLQTAATAAAPYDEYAYGYLIVQVGLYSPSQGWSWEYPVNIQQYMLGGDDFFASESGQPVFVTSPFSFTEGEIGNLVMQIYAYSEAQSVVPVPAAVLLGVLGLGVAGLKLRKLV